MSNLEHIMQEYFGAKDCDDMEAYEKLIDCVYEIGRLTEQDVDRIVERLDEIVNAEV